MARAFFTSVADAELTRIAAYIGKDNPTAALRWIEATFAVCEMLAMQPEIGQAVKTHRFGEVRRHVAGNYVIYYRSDAEDVQILHIVHGAREQSL
jgi:toxin ParE1/3/4